MQVSFDEQKRIVWLFFALLEALYFGWHEHCCKISLLWAATVRSIFTAIEAN